MRHLFRRSGSHWTDGTVNLMKHQVQVLVSISPMPRDECIELCHNLVINGLSARLGSSIVQAACRDLIQNMLMVIVPSLTLEFALFENTSHSIMNLFGRFDSAKRHRRNQ